MKLYNTLTRKIEEFSPNNKSTVKMYVCGITPYDTTHLGHAFTYSFFDVLNRYLRFKDYSVIYTQNVTDIDDDILKRAKEVGQNWQKLGDYWTKKYLNDTKRLNILPPDFYVKATDSIPEIIKITKDLINKGLAYEKNGNVYFEVSKRKEYGKLSRLNRAQMLKLSSERGADINDKLKKDPLDFFLWQKRSPEAEQRGDVLSAAEGSTEPSWLSPWGRGRPGWHIECSAMAFKYLGPQIDIHGGGEDLIYPHHESEIAQSENYTGHKPFAKYWLHTGAVRFNGEKMSKSLGNLVMISDLLKKYSSDAIRFMLLSHHYRNSWNFEEKELIEAEKKIDMVKKAVTNKSNKSTSDYTILEKFTSTLQNDMNTPKALSIIIEAADLTSNANSLYKMTKILGFKLKKSL